jgi:rhodanese-related sulfurtransferase
MSTLPNRLRSLAKEAALTACASAILLCVYFAALSWAPGRRAAEAVKQASKEIANRPELLPGKPLAVRGVDLARHAYSLFVITSPSCPYCRNSAPFHRRLIEAARTAGIPAWIVAPPSHATAAFLSTTGLQNAPLIDWRDLSRRFVGTPTVALVDSSGLIHRIWLGELTKDEEVGLLAAIRNPSEARQPTRKLTSGEALLTAAELRVLSRQGLVTLVSIAEREDFAQEHPPGAINVPLAELTERAQRDLAKSGLNVIDCSAIPEVVCSITLDQLRKMGFRIAAVDYAAVE